MPAQLVLIFTPHHKELPDTDIYTDVSTDRVTDVTTDIDTDGVGGGLTGV
jgi:hypothetical protein